jgi:hypothetical protein
MNNYLRGNNGSLLIWKTNFDQKILTVGKDADPGLFYTWPEGSEFPVPAISYEYRFRKTIIPRRNP